MGYSLTPSFRYSLTPYSLTPYVQEDQSSPAKIIPQAPGASRRDRPRADADFRHLAVGALAAGIKAADLFDFVTEKFQAQGLAQGRGKDVENAAATGEFAGQVDLEFVVVAEIDEAAAELFLGDFVADLELKSEGE